MTYDVRKELAGDAKALAVSGTRARIGNTPYVNITVVGNGSYSLFICLWLSPVQTVEFGEHVLHELHPAVHGAHRGGTHPLPLGLHTAVKPLFKPLHHWKIGKFNFSPKYLRTPKKGKAG
eukprot:207365-Prorocentrum_minimum.AAC.1